MKPVSDWHSLGIYLDLKTHQLDTIEKNHHGDDERCRTEMLIAWLNSTKTPTWEAIVEALGQMEQGRVADDIQRKYNVIISTTTIKGKAFLCIHASCSLRSFDPIMFGHCHSYSLYVYTYPHRGHNGNEAGIQ